MFDDIDSLFKNYPNRFYHIVSTFFLGLWVFNHKNGKFLYDSIINKLEQMDCCKYRDTKKQFTFVWFMATLFHDLGYLAEMEKEGRNLPCHHLDIYSIKSVPDFYADVYKNYYEYRENKEHGIYAGLKFDEDICKIREYQSNNPETKLDWREELEELYHYVAWIILSHNIYMIREEEENEHMETYNSNNNLKKLILSSERNEDGQYKEYKISFDKFPLFTFFCIIDTIEPLKSTSCLSNVDIQLKGRKIMIKSNDSVYRQKVLGLKDWLLPVYEENEMVIIPLGNSIHKCL